MEPSWLRTFKEQLHPYEDRADETVLLSEYALNSQLSEAVALTAGANFKTSKTQHYQKSNRPLGRQLLKTSIRFITAIRPNPI